MFSDFLLISFINYFNFVLITSSWQSGSAKHAVGLQFQLLAKLLASHFNAKPPLQSWLSSDGLFLLFVHFSQLFTCLLKHVQIYNFFKKAVICVSC